MAKVLRVVDAVPDATDPAAAVYYNCSVSLQHITLRIMIAPYSICYSIYIIAL